MLIYTRQTSLSSPILVCDEPVHSLFGDQDSQAAEAPAESMVITDSEDRAVTIINPWQQQSVCALLSFVLLTSSDGDDNDISHFSPLKMYPPGNQGKIVSYIFFSLFL